MIFLLIMPSSLAAELLVGEGYHTVQEAVDAANAGDTVVLGDGEWGGPITIEKSLTLTSRGGVLVGSEGSTVTVVSPGVVLDHVKIRGSGDDLRGPDCCVWVGPDARGTAVLDSELIDCLFGVWFHEVKGGRIERNHVEGRKNERAPSKGNGIHLFDSEDLVIADNVVEFARDGIYVGATENSLIEGNQVSDQRYGIHYMYSYDNIVRNNTANNNSGGLALMESRGLTIEGNIAKNNLRQGILFRDVQYSKIRNNLVVENGEGLFFFSSLDNEIVGNVLQGNQVGAKIWAGTERNIVERNSFIANRQQVFYIASEDQHWGSNYWSDYFGWDQDADGLGDRPYRTDTFMAQLLHRFPQAVLLLNSPTLEILAQLQTRLPSLRVKTIVDDHPLVARPKGE